MTKGEYNSLAKEVCVETRNLKEVIMSEVEQLYIPLLDIDVKDTLIINTLKIPDTISDVILQAFVVVGDKKEIRSFASDLIPDADISLTLNEHEIALTTIQEHLSDRFHRPVMFVSDIGNTEMSSETILISKIELVENLLIIELI